MSTKRELLASNGLDLGTLQSLPFMQRPDELLCSQEMIELWEGRKALYFWFCNHVTRIIMED
jgi:hypothetical protein